MCTIKLGSKLFYPIHVSRGPAGSLSHRRSPSHLLPTSAAGSLMRTQRLFQNISPDSEKPVENGIKPV